MQLDEALTRDSRHVEQQAASYRYKAFVSYSHAADGRFAPSMQHSLERFSASLFQRRVIEVFRDNTNLSLSPHLWPEIERALATSEFFILLASPQATRS